eukprot:COSAG02_NODE_240_length_27672_cov_67.291445_6_plen_90_part_00
MERYGKKAVAPRLRRPGLVVLLLVLAGVAPCPIAGFSECIEECIKTPTPQGHFDCCSNPLVSSFNKPSCSTGCYMAEVRLPPRCGRGSS